MLKWPSKGRWDLNAPGEAIVDQATGDNQETEAIPTLDGRNPAAVLFGRLGGLKGGKVGGAKLSTEKRKGIAKLAAKARWQNKT